MAIDIEYRTYEPYEIPREVSPIWVAPHIGDFDAYSIYNYYLSYIVEKVLRLPYVDIKDEVVQQGPGLFIPGKYIFRIKRFVADDAVPVYRLRKGIIYVYEEINNIQVLEAIVLDEVKYAAGLINDGTFGPYIK
mgnify:CR=1 FL=1